ncbi:MAG: 7TM diverse intracellular signaling domain-containing protein [Mucilaginibacter sp.]|uniref:sensor histidine kinase n=1 Tax=Mucilaginibacter sp. TaxID=1882438 RepID=UPI0032641705
MKRVLLFIFLFINGYFAFAGSDTLTIRENEVILINHHYFKQINDPSKKLTFDSILKRTDFVESPTDLPSLKVSNPVVWLKMEVKNNSNQTNIPITIGSTIIDSFDVFYQNKKTSLITHLEPDQSDVGYFSPKETIINFTIQPNSTQTIYIRIQSNSPNVIPIEVYSENKYWESYSSKNTGFGIFIGIVLIMIFYNLFLYFIIKDKSYLYYVCYVSLLSLSQGLLHGYRLHFADALILNSYVTPMVRVLLWLSITLFVNQFLQLKKQYKHIYKYFRILFFIWAVPVLFILIGRTNIAYTIITVCSTTSSILLLIMGIWLYRNGVKHAKFFMLAWSSFLISILISVGRNKDILPYNSFTSNALLYGFVLELVLFAIALADKINFYRDQNNDTQFFALQIAKENEKLITEQNIQLENMVLGRTKELLESNANLQGLITNLKAAQSQLIETEKMASLGQLTAGIAHEINNPINFVRSNIKPLKLDFKDLFDLLDQYAAIEHQPDLPEAFKAPIAFKQKIDLDFIRKEITDLLDGIEEGASRTAEIVQSLRAFSRTDEVELKPADINKSILNSLVLLRNTIPYYIEITPVFDKIEPINCYPGKLNQVFMNVIHNSIQAIIEKKKHNKESILIQTKDYPDNISIEITDTGAGMTEEVKQKMFDPFFTTKDVGEGTGLGLSIVFGIIEKHKGAIDVASKRGKGTTVVIMLPKTLS